MGMVYIISKAPEGYRWRLMSIDGQVIAVGAQVYATRAECVGMIELVRGSWSATIRDEIAT